MRARLCAILGVSAVAGAGTMVVELAAVRLLAPWFGASLVVWTNVIAVVLLALAVGYVFGGRLSEHPEPLRRLGWVLVFAAGLTFLLPSLAPRVTVLFLPDGLALHEAAGVLAWSSLAASCLLFLPPAMCLGMVAPLAVEAVQREGGGGAGRAGGLVLAMSTLGSLTGVFSTSLLLLPGLGLEGTHRVAAACLVAAAAMAFFLGAKRSLPPAVLILFVFAGGRWILGEAPERSGTARVLARAESPYQSVRVVEDTSFERTLRFLQVNEGFDSYQSVWQADPGLLPEGFYYNAFALPAWWSEAEGTWRLLVLGLGAGTVFRVLEGASPAALSWERIGIEIDPVVVRLAREHMGLVADAPGTTVLGDLDARAALRLFEEPLDYVVLDCYANQVEIPPHLATVEFFAMVRAKLVPGGWLAINVGGFGFDDPIVHAVAQTCAEAFASEVLLLRVPAARNFVLFARRDAPLPLDAAGELRLPPGPLGKRVAPLALPGGWSVVSPRSAEAPLTDDHAPTEWLQARSIEEARERLAAPAEGGSP